jgi:hypothetical protein
MTLDVEPMDAEGSLIGSADTGKMMSDCHSSKGSVTVIHAPRETCYIRT